MITISPILHSRPNKQGKFPLALRITKDRKSSRIFLGQVIEKKEWDNNLKRVKRNHSNSQRLNEFLSKKIAELNEMNLTLELRGENVSSQDLAERMRIKLSPLKAKKKNSTKNQRSKNNPNYMETTTHEYNSFFEVAGNYLDNLEKEGKYNQLTSSRARVKRFWTFLHEKDIGFDDITVKLLNDYKAYLKGAHKNSERSAINNLLLIRTLYNRAIRDDKAKSKNYPFGKGKIIIKFPESMKIGLNEDEITKLIKLNLSGKPHLANSRNIWLTSFYFAGMRISDVLRLRWSDIQDGRLHYKMGKNEKVGSLKIPEPAIKIFDQYRKYKTQNDSLIFQELKNVEYSKDLLDIKRKIKSSTKRVNSALEALSELAKIDKKLTSHIARHSFGSISGGKIPLHILQHLFRHSHITTTMNYMKSFRFEEADEALKSVISF